jgi:hypothetical protein
MRRYGPRGPDTEKAPSWVIDHELAGRGSSPGAAVVPGVRNRDGVGGAHPVVHSYLRVTPSMTSRYQGGASRDMRREFRPDELCR